MFNFVAKNEFFMAVLFWMKCEQSINLIELDLFASLFEVFGLVLVRMNNSRNSFTNYILWLRGRKLNQYFYASKKQ